MTPSKLSTILKSPIHLKSSNLLIYPIPIFTDNYSYIIRNGTHACLVDCAEPDVVLKAVKELGLEVAEVLTTHKHWDHAGGNAAIAKSHPKIPIYGPSEAESVTHILSHNDTIKICNNAASVSVLESPCHTKGHLMYYIDNEAIFTGDTFFVCGCGRFFEGDAAQMWHNVSLMRKLPGHVKMFCGHEYTLSNMKFALTVDPDNEALQKKYQWAQEQRQNGLPTIPSTLADEFATNPFFRCDQKALQEGMGSEDPVEVMRKLREKKDHF